VADFVKKVERPKKNQKKNWQNKKQQNSEILEIREE